jgi:hypothetical protein
MEEGDEASSDCQAIVHGGMKATLGRLLKLNQKNRGEASIEVAEELPSTFTLKLGDRRALLGCQEVAIPMMMIRYRDCSVRAVQRGCGCCPSNQQLAWICQFCVSARELVFRRSATSSITTQRVRVP